MNRTRYWSLYVSAYTFAAGVTLLFFTDRYPYLDFAPGDRIWVKFAGMTFLAFSYFNVVLFRKRLIPLIRVTFVSQAVFAVVTTVVAILLEAGALYLVSAVLLIGMIGSTLTWISERKSYVPIEFTKWPRTRFWNLYVACYTGCFGLGPILVPRRFWQLVGFEYAPGLWIKFVGMSFLVLSYYNIVTYRDQGPETSILAILFVRVWFILVLAVLALSGEPPILYGIIGIVVFGILGTIQTYRNEKNLVRSDQG